MRLELFRNPSLGRFFCGASGSLLTALLALLLLGQPANAHHPFGGELPNTIWIGLLSGLGHPVIGLDHLAFVIAMGAIAFSLASRSDQDGAAMLPKGGFIIVAAFLMAAVVGTGIHLQEWSLPAPELAISCSVFLFGAMLLIQRQYSVLLIAAIAAFAGLFHGYAYGEAVVGAESAPIVAYLLGFTLIQGAIAIASGLLIRRACFRSASDSSRLTTPTGFPLVVALGGVISGVGFTFLFNLFLG